MVDENFCKHRLSNEEEDDIFGEHELETNLSDNDSFLNNKTTYRKINK